MFHIESLLNLFSGFDFEAVEIFFFFVKFDGCCDVVTVYTER